MSLNFGPYVICLFFSRIPLHFFRLHWKCVLFWFPIKGVVFTFWLFTELETLLDLITIPGVISDPLIGIVCENKSSGYLHEVIFCNTDSEPNIKVDK